MPVPADILLLMLRTQRVCESDMCHEAPYFFKGGFAALGLFYFGGGKGARSPC